MRDIITYRQSVSGHTYTHTYRPTCRNGRETAIRRHTGIHTYRQTYIHTYIQAWQADKYTYIPMGHTYIQADIHTYMHTGIHTLAKIHAYRIHTNIPAHIHKHIHAYRRAGRTSDI